MNGLRWLLALVLALVCALPQACLAASSPAAPEVVYIEDSQMFSDLHVPTYIWMPDGVALKGICVAMHGGCLHGRNFEHLARLLAARGYMLVSMDMLGYGKYHYSNYGGDYGKTFHYKHSMRNVVAIVNRLREKYPDTRIFGVGESLGANAAMQIAAEQPHLLDGIIVVSGYARARLKLAAHPYMVVHALQFVLRPTSRLNLAPNLNSNLAEKKEWALEQTSDPLARDRQSVVELLRSLFFNKRGSRLARQIPADTPVLFIHGQRDRLCAPKATFGLYNKLNIIDKQFKLLPGRGHLLVETAHIPPEVMQILTEWLDSHIGGNPTRNEGEKPNE
jgi:alpha-beta hydrolase superfamily lysophospholipase